MTLEKAYYGGCKPMDKVKQHGARELLGSLLSLFLVGLFLASSVSPLVTQKLITTPLTTNSRYAVTFPALEYIEELGDESVVAIGTSIIRSSVNGSCITNEIDRENLGVFNLGIKGANPYTEMVQIPALVQADPELVLVELGPNGLWNFYDSDDLNEYIQFRFTINSINMRTKHLGEWTNLIRDIDQQWVAKTDIERINLTKSYSQVAAEEFLKQHVSKYTDLVEFEERAPLPGDPDWHRYLMEPYYRTPYFEKMSSDEIRDFMDKQMPEKVNQGVYKPKSNGTLNHIAYDYMIDTLRENNIPVLLVATPHHPFVYDYLSPNQLDGFNSTFSHYANMSGVFGINMFWENWHSSMFRDRNHLGVNGREYFCERISPVIEEILETNQLVSDSPLGGNVNLENYLEERCNGNDRTFHLTTEIEFIQAETFSDCAMGEGIASQDHWQYRNGGEYRGSGYLHALPEDHSFFKEKLNGSRLDYNLTVTKDGEYFVWVKMRGNGYSNDSIDISSKLEGEDYSSIVSYKSYGWSSNGQWEWEPEFNAPPISFNATVGDKVTLSIWMQEDGVMIDEILITSISTLNPNSIDVYSIEKRDLTCSGSGNEYTVNHEQTSFFEAEDFSSCEFGEGDALFHTWKQINDNSSSGDSYLKAVPEEGVHMRNGLMGPRLIFDLNFETPGTYFLWLSMRGDSYSNDSIGVGWTDGVASTEMVYASFGWDSEGQWEWEPRVSREPFEIHITEPGISSVVLTMREDGVEIDRFVLSPDPGFDPIKELA